MSIATYLIVGEVNVLHGKHGEFIGARWESAMLHVASDGEQLGGSHYMRCGVEDDLICAFVGDCFVLAEVQRVQGAIRRILKNNVKLIRESDEKSLKSMETKNTFVAHCKAKVRAQADNSSC